ncbi:hypothetical protein UFOVP708_20 [uncultured Caudovirales phage]|uniref:Uncharacterized protein n=1 Tax=uncultured Caudovirales phage TaxID=2100421 RepID=A0A6J5NP16_9CAUD|nr:hypothetical protein UFOVP708_20 [uncultured Caudovirales phage]
MTYGCHNRPPLRSVAVVQAGWRYVTGSDGQPTRIPVIRRVGDPMSKDCQHTIGAPDDPGCGDCRWKKRDEW